VNECAPFTDCERKITVHEMDNDLELYRKEVRHWLAANLRRSADGASAMSHVRPERSRAHFDEQRALQRRIHDAGYTGISWPAEYGGRGLTAEHERVFSEEAVHYEMPDFGFAGITTGTCSKTIRVHASEAFRQEHLPRVLAGEEIWVQFLSEPAAGSDLAGIQTRAIREGDHWILSGGKIWSSDADIADWGLCLARTDWDVPKHSGLTWFAVPTDAPGLTIRPIRQISDESEFCEEFFDDVVVPDTYRIGDVNDGWTVATTLMAFERGAERYSERDGGLRAIDGPGPLAPDLVALARRVGRDQDPVVRQLIARAHGNDYLVNELNARIALRMRLASRDSNVAGYVKLARGMFEPERGQIGVAIGGGAAVTWDPEDTDGAETSQTYLMSRLRAIAAGSNEMQRNGIGERVLRLPPEPSFDREKPFNQVLRDARQWTGRI
jgi:alkylation response protein AidB-like acyl-CoA dehydrogenase